MGGWGSGRREYATTPTVEECHHLSSDDVTDAVKNPGHGGRIYWGDPDDPDASIRAVFLSADHVTALKEGQTLETEPVDADAVEDATPDERARAVYLSYTITDPRTDESRDVSSLVPIEYTDCHFGGVRPWFRCPTGAGGCERRVGKLYLPPRGDHYLCRECHDLGYRSSRTSGDDLKQAELRYRRAFAKADAEDRRPHPNNPPYTPDRPKGTHRDTFDDLLADVREAEREWEEQMNERMWDLLDQADTGAEHAARAFGYTDR